MTRSSVVNLKTGLVLIVTVYHLNQGPVSNTDAALLAYIKPMIFLAVLFPVSSSQEIFIPYKFLHDGEGGLVGEYCISMYKYSQSRWPRHLRRSLCCWDCWFETRRGHGCLSLVSVVCYQVK
jgi:hypothetical protein